MKIYTKTGDKGTTRLVDGSCVEKHNPRVEAYGSIDELNSYLGLVDSHLKLESTPLHELSLIVQKTQHHLFRIGSLVASGNNMSLSDFNSLPQININHIEFLEQNIDLLTAKTPELKNFILPTGSLCISHIHFARTLCRRSERRVSEVLSLHPAQLSPSLIYLNRLSDYLFTLARYVAVATSKEEIKWDKSE